MSNKKKRSRVTGEGLPCPKCGRKMERKGHGPAWKPKPSQPYFFAYWDVCKRCRHMQHYEAAKTLVDIPAT